MSIYDDSIERYDTFIYLYVNMSTTLDQSFYDQKMSDT